MNKFEQFIKNNKDELNTFANNYIDLITQKSSEDFSGQYSYDLPENLKKSMKYSLINDGKKIRPLSFLYLLNYYEVDYKKYYDVALAIELVHTYSLVHDDLPAMDNDDYRWKKLTNHKVFGEDVAILTGDAMLTLAFEILADCEVEASKKVKLIKLFSNYAGATGMIAGQIYDVKQSDYKVDAAYLKNMHSLKTGKLIILPLLFANLIAGKDNEVETILNFAKELGVAYQIKDDILDYYGDFEKIGKLPSDENKITYLSFYGIEECEKLLEMHTNEAIHLAQNILKSIFLNVLHS